jgi:predicted aspartyl protease
MLLATGVLAQPAAQPPAGQRQTLSILGTGSHPFVGDMFVPEDALSSTIPFSRAGNLIVIRAKADSTEGNFILDTGAPGLILNMTYFRHYRSYEWSDPGDAQGGITGATSAASPALVAELQLGPFAFKRVPAHRIQLGHLEDQKGIRILGLLGVHLFTRFEMIIDYQTNEIHLHRIGLREKKNWHHALLGQESLYHTLPITVRDGKLFTAASIAGKKLTFVIDTGAESNVLDSRLSDKVFEQVEVQRRITVTGAGSGQLEALYGTVKHLQLPGRQFAAMPVVVVNLERMSGAYEKQIDGMLGFDFLSRHRVGFNFMTNKMYIWK